MKTVSPDRLDKATSKWPEVRITLRDPDDTESGDNSSSDVDDAGPRGQVQPAAAAATVTVSGVITDVTDEAEALTRTAAQARTLGRPIRARITHTPACPTRRVIVDTDGIVTHLDGPPATQAVTPAGAAAPAAAGLTSPRRPTSDAGAARDSVRAARGPAGSWRRSPLRCARS